MTPGTYRLGPDVILVQDDGVARLLDFDRGRFYALNPVGSRMLALSLGHGAEEAAARLAAEYDVPPAQVRADLAVLLRDLEGKRLLVPPHAPARLRPRLLAALDALLWCADRVLVRALRGAARAAGALRGREAMPGGAPAVPGPRALGLLLTLAWVSLRLFGWSGTLAIARRWHRGRALLAGAARARVVDAVDRLVREAAVRKLCFPSACKERALAGYQVLRALYGLPAALVVGVRCHPFGAHAWVECDGRVVTDDPAHCELYTPVLRCN
jgi:hypothetical protein